jgi:hypothetical protein
VISRDSEDYITPSSQKHSAKWICQCDCGNLVSVLGRQLRNGHTKSCGCLQRERTANANRRHGGRYDRLHSVWSNMKNRCYNPNYAEFKDYGGRGITVCDEWLNYPEFKAWAISAGYNQSVKRGVLTLDRIDINKGYSPDNCRFVDMYVQANNKQNNIRYSVDGKEHTLAEWSKILNIDYDYLYYRVRTKQLPIESVIADM